MMKLSGTIDTGTLIEGLKSTVEAAIKASNGADKFSDSLKKVSDESDKAATKVRALNASLDNSTKTREKSNSTQKEGLTINGQEVDVTGKLILNQKTYSNGSKMVTKYLSDENSKKKETITITQKLVDGEQKLSAVKEVALKKTSGLNAAIDGQNELFKKSQYSFANL